MNPIDRPAVSWPEQSAIALIALPVAVFFGTWFRPIIGFPAAAVAIWTAWTLMRSISPSPLPPRRTVYFLALFAVLWTCISGLGAFCNQLWDHNFRNAVLHDLINHPWPVLWNTPKGTVALDYYLAWSMFPALVGKALGWKAATLALAIICAFGVFLVLLMFVRILGVWRWWLPFVFLLWSGIDIVGWMLRRQIPDIKAWIDYWSMPLFYISNFFDYQNVAHIALPCWIVTLLVVGRRVPPSGTLGLAAFLVPLAPFTAIGVAPFVAWGWLQGEGRPAERLRGILTLQNLVTPVVFAALCAPLYLGNQGLGMESGWFLDYDLNTTASKWINFGEFLLLKVLLPSAAIWMAGQRDRLFVLAILVLCLIPLRRAGLSNDLALKVSVPGLMILTLYTARAFISNVKGRAKWFLIGVFSLGAVSPMQELCAAMYFTITSPNTREADHILTFDPTNSSSFPQQEFFVNFRSRPLTELPVLRRMLGQVPSTAQSRDPQTRNENPSMPSR
jgi:hypothetical protein